MLRKQKKYLFVRGAVMLVAAFLIMCAAMPCVALAEDGSVRIHVLSYSDGQDAIVIESNGRFGMVDSGEDNDCPDGSDARYPYRYGIAIGGGHEEEAISYLYSVGATPDTFDFYIGTHAHSDHIGSADEIIYEFMPERVYVPDYQDSYISNPAHLWDNQYVFDHMQTAAQDVGASFISSLSWDAPLVPTKDEGNTGYPAFSFGSAQITIMNWENHPLGPNAYDDANNYSWGVKVDCGGKSAFLAGDIENGGGDEDALAEQLGHVDLLKLGHHGFSSSNTPNYLMSLSPSYAIVTGKCSNICQSVADALLACKSHVYYAPESAEQGKRAVVVTLSGAGISADALADPTAVILRETFGSHEAVAFQDGAPHAYQGTLKGSSGRSYVFDGTPYGVLETPEQPSSKGEWRHDAAGWWWRRADGSWPASCWQKIDGVWYYFQSSGYMATGWVKDGSWYYFDPSGALATGWRCLGGEWYYLDPASSGALAIGLFYDGSTLYVSDHNGVCPASGWVLFGGQWYRTSSSCAVCKGWVLVGSTWYWLDTQTGVMATGWKKLNGVQYYLDASGAMATGWRQIKGTWYYFNSSGSMYTGWKNDGGSWYWLDQKTGAMLANGWTPDGYYVNASGAWVPGKTR